MPLTFELLTTTAQQAIAVSVDELVIAGWTGRDQAAVDAHIAELEAIGVTRPSNIPTYYRVGAALLTTATTVEVVGNGSSGEVEFVLFTTEHGLCVGVGSDHTDREVERAGVTISKQLCPKPVASEVWSFADISQHWDELILRSYVLEGDEKILYQEGSVSAMQDPIALLNAYTDSETVTPGLAMFCGTFSVIGQVRPASGFAIELEDPVLKRKLSHHYDIKTLPIAD